jgi:hypothetical protein
MVGNIFDKYTLDSAKLNRNKILGGCGYGKKRKILWDFSYNYRESI